MVGTKPVVPDFYFKEVLLELLLIIKPSVLSFYETVEEDTTTVFSKACSNVLSEQ